MLPLLMTVNVDKGELRNYDDGIAIGILGGSLDGAMLDWRSGLPQEVSVLPGINTRIGSSGSCEAAINE